MQNFDVDYSDIFLEHVTLAVALDAWLLMSLEVCCCMLYRADIIVGE